MTEFEQLNAIAYKTERACSRRLERHAGLTELDALKRTLEASAGLQGLARLLAARHAARDADTARAAARALAKADLLALKRSKHRPPPSAWLAWFDGSAHPNPGEIGIGALLRGPDGQQFEISEGAGYGNSSEAEYHALIAVLAAAVQRQPAQLVIYGDSRVVIDDVNQSGGGARSLQAQREQVRSLMAQLSDVTLRWIPRHKNGAADALSQRAALHALQSQNEREAS
jgi:ribonuclease HI